MDLVLKYPPFNVRIKKDGTQTRIFDFIRKRWLVLTPEEWVRQHVLNYLVNEKKFPASSVSLEKELRLNDLKKRYDIVVFNRQLKPYLIVECKAPYIALDKSVVEQALRYNLVIRSPLLMITNGITDFVFNHNNQVTELAEYGAANL